VDEEEGFLVVLATAPTDITTHLVYADWLEEHDDLGSECLRAWVELVQLPYEDARYRVLLALVERFQASLKCAEPEWVELVGRSRDWVDSALAEKVTRLHLRVRHGRKSDRQWLRRADRSVLMPVWRVSYWRHNPAMAKGNSWHLERDRCTVEVDQVTATVTEVIRRRTRPVLGTDQPAG
jgi:uncharacterized protein (TIGR02996 family)